jgi:hypothetical protein
LGVSQEDLAHQLGFHRTDMDAVERDERDLSLFQSPSEQHLVNGEEVIRDESN